MPNARGSRSTRCYTLAATAAREADAWDLWACALTRHAYLSLYEQQPADAVPMLGFAMQVACRGDPMLSTRHWTAAVLAQTLAGTGDDAGCERALETAEMVTGLTHPYHGGWLRFDGSRLAEARPGRADPHASGDRRSGRRRGITLVDLALVGTQVNDPLRVVTHGFAALDHARNTASGVIVRKLENLRPLLVPMRSDPHIRNLHQEIAALHSAVRL